MKILLIVAFVDLKKAYHSEQEGFVTGVGNTAYGVGGDFTEHNPKHVKGARVTGALSECFMVKMFGIKKRG